MHSFHCVVSKETGGMYSSRERESSVGAIRHTKVKHSKLGLSLKKCEYKCTTMIQRYQVMLRHAVFNACTSMHIKT